MTIKYLYLDDEANSTTEAIVAMLGRQRRDLEITYQYPKVFSEQASEIMSKGFDGLLLDLRLDQVAQTGEPKADYGAFALAQEIRARATDNRLPDLPIILCSTEVNLNKSFRHDDTSHDLFDLFILKDTIYDQLNLITLRMVSLSCGYKALAETFHAKKDIYEIIGIDKEFFEKLDPRIWGGFVDDFLQYPPHEFARFLLRELFDRSGPLIDEVTLAARLGVDLSTSTEWKVVTDALRTAEYNGPFSEGWRTWWTKKVELWWEALEGCPGRLKNLPAKARVEFLKLRFGGHLNPAPPIEEGYSEAYWTVCAATGKPLDPLDGFIAAGPDPKPWQDKTYLSIYAAINRIGFANGIKVHPIERDRFESIKASIRERDNG